ARSRTESGLFAPEAASRSSSTCIPDRSSKLWVAGSNPAGQAIYPLGVTAASHGTGRADRVNRGVQTMVGGFRALCEPSRARTRCECHMRPLGARDHGRIPCLSVMSSAFCFAFSYVGGHTSLPPEAPALPDPCASVLGQDSEARILREGLRCI